ncbi:MAG TPA: methionine--tRNA ligase [Candidatus Paceibacterota bacterium]|nr:methionine--tRNA ligase [Candidatus Paceibacterota bacterium]
MSARYLTTTLPYVNADPHIGFALEIVQADALARVWRAAGDDVFFSTGTDEHGQKIYEAAEKAGQEPQAYVDRYAAEFRKLKEALNLSNDTFIRTTDPAHVAAAGEMWRRCAAAGDIEMREYEGLYCVGHEAFVTEKDLVDGKCPDHGREPELLKERNYFFTFSKYQDRLLEYLSRPDSIIPDWRREEAIAFVKGGLEDFSISREKARLSWGIPVPGDETQIMYVWFDALTNYISTLSWPDESGNFKKYWTDGQTLQVAGKDQVRFQSLMWQAMLMSAGVKTTDQVFYHGFITSGGKKMSKSLGNVINPLDLVEKYGTDAVRYVLLRHVSPTEDSDLTLDAIHEHYTAHLTNGLGNLVARVMKLAEEHVPEPIAVPAIETLLRGDRKTFESFAFNEVLDRIWHEIGVIDQVMTNEKPFAVVKEDAERGRRLITQCVEQLAVIAQRLAPFMPGTSEKVIAAVRANKKPENLFPRI